MCNSFWGSLQTDNSNLNWNEKTLINELLVAEEEGADDVFLSVINLKVKLNNLDEAIVVYNKNTTYNNDSFDNKYSLLANSYRLSEDTGEMEWSSSTSTLSVNENIEQNFSMDLNDLSHGICVFGSYQADGNINNIFASRYTK